MKKFKIGDKIVGNKKANARYNVTREGWRGIVTHVYPSGMIEAKGEGLFGHTLTPFKLDPKYFDLVDGTAKNKKVVITTDGKTTLARLYEGNKVTKSAKAECSPDDKFDFEKGATLAYSRLFDTDFESKPYNGKIVCVKSPVRYYTVGKIYEVKNGRVVCDDGDVLGGDKIKTFENWQRLSCAEWLEVVE